MSVRNTVFLAGALALLLICAAAVRAPGIYWLVGYGPEGNYSFHPDDERFIISAKNFEEKFVAKRDGYPLFMVTQLFVVNKFLQSLLHLELDTAVVLRCISLFYGLFSVILIYVCVTSLGYSRFIGVLASFFLAFAPLHIISSHFGTADITVWLLFYMTIFAAWQYRLFNEERWLYATTALAGVAMATKFFLPALVAPAMIILLHPPGKMWRRLFVSACIFTAFFCAASFFNFTPWDLKKLVDMLHYENMVVEGKKSPVQQIVLYSWDLIPSSGVITSTLALCGCLVLCSRAGISWIRQAAANLTRRPIIFNAKRFMNWLYSPASILIVPLIFFAFLIFAAQVHAARHVLVFVPVVCLLAAIAVDAMFKLLRGAPPLVRGAGAAAILALMTAQFVDGFVTDKVYAADIRIDLANFLDANGFARQSETFISYTHLKDVSILPLLSDRTPTAPVFITCDIEYERYMSAGKGIPTYHVFGGAGRTKFYMSLFNGTTDYVPIFRVTRKPESLEDRLAYAGLLPQLDYFVPNECYAFKKG
jgi:hypothetical protein